jgi:hypothetical protein
MPPVLPEIADCDGPGNSNSMPARMAMISNDNEEFNQSDTEISNSGLM